MYQKASFVDFQSEKEAFFITYYDLGFFILKERWLAATTKQLPIDKKGAFSPSFWLLVWINCVIGQVILTQFGFLPDLWS